MFHPPSSAKEFQFLRESIRSPLRIFSHQETSAIFAQFLDEKINESCKQIGVLPPLYPEWLGDRSFTAAHAIRFPYIVGEMANGIASVQMVCEAARAGFLGFFGAAGLNLSAVANAIDTISDSLPGMPWGINLIHSPMENGLEEAVVDLYIRKNVRRVSASAFMKLTPALVRYACYGLYVDANGVIQRRNHLFAKVSRLEVATLFMEPAPEGILAQLVERRLLTPDEAKLARLLPLASDITIESDSGGHTDNQPLGPLFASAFFLRKEILAKYSFRHPIRLGAAGGISTPASVAAAFAMGASYVLTGSVNQSCIEAGISSECKKLLATLDVKDVMMAPCGDMFEMGVRVQVVSRGTMYGVRARRLYELYKKYDSIEGMDERDLSFLEKNIFPGGIDQAIRSTLSYWQERNPNELLRAERDPKHRMALLFRSYLGLSSRFAIAGASERIMDYQIWCGPAMGAFNRWVKGSFLESVENRSVVQVGLNLLEGAAVLLRSQQLQNLGVDVGLLGFDFVPRKLALGDGNGV